MRSPATSPGVATHAPTAPRGPIVRARGWINSRADCSVECRELTVTVSVRPAGAVSVRASQPRANTPVRAKRNGGLYHSFFRTSSPSVAAGHDNAPGRLLCPPMPNHSCNLSAASRSGHLGFWEGGLLSSKIALTRADFRSTRPPAAPPARGARRVTSRAGPTRGPRAGVRRNQLPRRLRSREPRQ